MRFARVVFTLAAVYGFIGLALLWQMVFVLVAKDPLRYRPIMPIAILEKLVYSVPVLILYSLGKARASTLGPALVDPVFGVLFVIAYWRTWAVPRTGS